MSAGIYPFRQRLEAQRSRIVKAMARSKRQGQGKRQFLKDKYKVIAKPDLSSLGKRITHAMDLSIEAIQTEPELSQKILKSLHRKYLATGDWPGPCEMTEEFYKRNLANDLSQTYWDRDRETMDIITNLYTVAIEPRRKLIGKRNWAQGKAYALHRRVNFIHLTWDGDMQRLFNPIVEMIGDKTYQQGTWKTASGQVKPRTITLKDSEIAIVAYCIACFSECSYTFVNEVFRHISVTGKKPKTRTQRVFIDRNKISAIVRVLLANGIIEVSQQGGDITPEKQIRREATQYVFCPCHTQSDTLEEGRGNKGTNPILDCV